MSNSLRHKVVAVAVVFDAASNRYLLCHNLRWNGYAFPMKHVEPGEDPAAAALAAVQGRDLPLSWPNATATPIGRFGEPRFSEGVHALTYYDYHLYAIDPGAPLPSEPLDPMLTLLTYDELLAKPSVTASTQAIAKALIESRQVVSTVICRRGKTGPEVLLVFNLHYKYFLPSARMKTELHVGQAAHAVVREELGYPGPVQFGRMELVEETQHSPRTGRPAEFHIHLIETTFPDLDLHQPGNRLEEAFEALHPRQLSRPGAPQKPWWEWVPLDALSTRSDLSPTWALVRGAIERLCAGKSVR